MIHSPRRVRLVLLCLLFIPFPIPVEASNYPKTIRDATGHKITLKSTPKSVFSGGLNIDSTLLKLLPPERVAAVTRYARRPDYSFVADSASQRPAYKQVRPEPILKHDPDLVILTVYTRAGIRQKIRDLDVPVLVTGKVNSKADIRKNTLMIARAVGKTEKARNWLRLMNRELKKISDSRPGQRVLHYTYSGAVPGRGTLPDFIMSSAGLRNVASKVGIQGWKVISPENIIKADPDSIVFEERNRDQLIGELRSDPALKTLTAVEQENFRSVQSKYLTVASPFIHRAANEWAQLFKRKSHVND